ncbi:MAG: hypothetical protein IGS50_13680 [Synechococcales cyanobacterium C42_A2020_086]|nr:hypothetical protein [Synechococcales cyanobacterium C42_A2020_086]
MSVLPNYSTNQCSVLLESADAQGAATQSQETPAKLPAAPFIIHSPIPRYAAVHYSVAPSVTSSFLLAPLLTIRLVADHHCGDATPLRFQAAGSACRD